MDKGDISRKTSMNGILLTGGGRNCKKKCYGYEKQEIPPEINFFFHFSNEKKKLVGYISSNDICHDINFFHFF